MVGMAASILPLKTGDPRLTCAHKTPKEGNLWWPVACTEHERRHSRKSDTLARER